VGRAVVDPAALLASRVIGSFVWETDVDVVYADGGLQHLLGLIPQPGTGGNPMSEYLSLAIPQDRSRLTAALDLSLSDGVPLFEACTLSTPTSYRFLLIKGRAQIRRGRGAIVFGHVHDLSGGYTRATADNDLEEMLAECIACAHRAGQDFVVYILTMALLDLEDRAPQGRHRRPSAERPAKLQPQMVRKNPGKLSSRRSRL
jgi:hypothetical protein